MVDYGGFRSFRGGKQKCNWMTGPSVNCLRFPSVPLFFPSPEFKKKKLLFFSGKVGSFFSKRKENIFFFIFFFFGRKRRRGQQVCRRVSCWWHEIKNNNVKNKNKEIPPPSQRRVIELSSNWMTRWPNFDFVSNETLIDRWPAFTEFLLRFLLATFSVASDLTPSYWLLPC